MKPNGSTQQNELEMTPLITYTHTLILNQQEEKGRNRYDISRVKNNYKSNIAYFPVPTVALKYLS